MNKLFLFFGILFFPITFNRFNSVSKPSNVMGNEIDAGMKIIELAEFYDYLVPKDVVIRQAKLESNHFKSTSARKNNNYFGHMKGKHLKKYNSVDECVKYHVKLLSTKYNPKSRNFSDWADALQKHGYSNSNNYSNTLKRMK